MTQAVVGGVLAVPLSPLGGFVPVQGTDDILGTTLLQRLGGAGAFRHLLDDPFLESLADLFAGRATVGHLLT
jgi:hypothetical protein